MAAEEVFGISLEAQFSHLVCRNVEAPRIDAHHLDSVLLAKPSCGIDAHAGMGLLKIWCVKVFFRVICANQDNIHRLKFIAFIFESGDLCLNLIDRDVMAPFSVMKIEDHAFTETPFERYPIYGF